MKVGELVPAVAKRVPFSLRYQKRVPNESGCYVLATFDGDVLYAGLSDKLRRRFGQHREVKEKRAATSLGKAFWFYYLETPERERKRLERSWQNQYCTAHGKLPVLNKVASPVS